MALRENVNPLAYVLGQDPVVAIIGAMRLLGKTYGWVQAPLSVGVTFPPDSLEGTLVVLGNPRLVGVPNSPASEVLFFVAATLATCQAGIDEQYDTIWATQVRAAKPLIRDLKRSIVRLREAQSMIASATAPDGSLKPNVAAYAWDSIMYGTRAISAARAASPGLKNVFRDELLAAVPGAPKRVLDTILNAGEASLKWAARTVGETLKEFGFGTGLGGIVLLAVAGFAAVELSKR